MSQSLPDSPISQRTRRGVRLRSQQQAPDDQFSSLDLIPQLGPQQLSSFSPPQSRAVMPPPPHYDLITSTSSQHTGTAPMLTSTAPTVNPRRARRGPSLSIGRTSVQQRRPRRAPRRNPRGQRQGTPLRRGARASQSSRVGLRSPPSPGSLQQRPLRADLGKDLALLKSSVPTLRRVPKGARILVAQAMKSILEEVKTANSVSTWEDLLLFPYAVLQVPQESDEVTNLTTWVRGNVRFWEQDRARATPQPRLTKASRKAKDSDQLVAKKVEAKLADGDMRGALRLLESDDTMAPNDQHTLNALREKHPPHPEPADFPLPPDAPPVIQPVTPGELLKAVQTFAPGTAGGLDSMRPQVFKDLLAHQVGDAATELASAICNFLDIVVSGEVPEAVRPVFFGASLTPLKKKSGGIRPIAVSCGWRRLVSKIILGRITPELKEYLQPHQLGVGVKGGSEIGAHAARAYYNADHGGVRVFLKLDFRNAFNEIRRDRLLTIISDRFQSAFAFINQAYGAPSNLYYYGSTTIESRRGVFQGDPLGPALFALVVQPIVEALQLELNLWYLDDGTLGDTPEKTLEALRFVMDKAEEIGLHLNSQKSKLAILGAESEGERANVLESFRAIAPGIMNLDPQDVTLLGSPLCMPAVENVLVLKTANLKKLAHRLLNLASHSAFFLLRASISLPRLIYFLRCAPAFRRRAHLVDYDAELKIGLEKILNCSLNDESWLQSSLPVKSGGLGIRQAVDTAIPCFLASVHACLPHATQLLPAAISLMDANVQDAMEQWEEHFHLGGFPPEEIRAVQDTWESPLFRQAAQQLLVSSTAQGDQLSQARLLASACPEAAAWLSALPSPSLGTHLDNTSFRIATALRLGCIICQPHVCHCGARLESNGLHGLSCQKSAGRHSRHSAANDIISRALRSAEVPNTKEPVGCSRADGKRPDGLTLVPWKRGRSLVWDFTCVDTFAPSHLAATCLHSGRAARDAAAAKTRKYSYLVDRYDFVPVAVETSGVWDRIGLRFVMEVGFRVPAVTGEKRAASYLLQRLSLAVQRGNVLSAILGTLPDGDKLEEILEL